MELNEKKSDKKSLSKKLKEVTKLKRMLKKGIVKFSYKRIDGTLRKARGTMNPDYLPETDKDSSSKRKENKDVVTYFDLSKDDYRSFRKENFVEIIE